MLPPGYIYTVRDDPEQAGEYEFLRRYDIHWQGVNVASLLLCHNAEDDFLWLETVRVLPEHRRQGLARYLMEQMMLQWPGRRVRGMCAPFADKPVSYEGLFAFYRSLGFRLLCPDQCVIEIQL